MPKIIFFLVILLACSLGGIPKNTDKRFVSLNAQKKEPPHAFPQGFREHLMLNEFVAPYGQFNENINGVLLELVRIPSGRFQMGDDRSSNPEEKPAHLVSVQSIYLGRYEITRQQWNIVAATLPRVNRVLEERIIGSDPRLLATSPVGSISWAEAVEFCDRLSRFTGRKYRLPSEAEWEYACRAGTTSEYSFGDQFNPAFANLELVADYPLPVGQLGYANAWGLYDMHGNISEWCLDIVHPNYLGAPTDGSSWELGGDANTRIARGGAYRRKATLGRSAARWFSFRSGSTSWDGFRVVAEISPIVGAGRVATVSAASYSGATLASESIAALFGGNLSTATQVASSLPLPFTLAGASVNLKDSSGNEYLAPLFFASTGQINFLIPSGLALGRGMVSVVTNGVIHSTGPLEIASVNPGLFAANATGKDVAAALALRVKSNGEQVYEPVATFDASLNRFVPVAINLSNPNEQVFLVLFGTGFRNRTSLPNTSATVGGQSVEVLFAGAQGDLVGVDQCNLRLSPNLAGRGDVNVSITVDGLSSNTVQIRIR